MVRAAAVPRNGSSEHDSIKRAKGKNFRAQRSFRSCRRFLFEAGCNLDGKRAFVLFFLIKVKIAEVLFLSTDADHTSRIILVGTDSSAPGGLNRHC